MSEVFELLSDKWKGVFSVGWCDLCRTAYIRCPKCENISCNCAGCEFCAAEEWKDFEQYKTRVEDYLNEDEIKIYEKCERLKKFICEEIRRGNKEIDFHALKKVGRFSKTDEELFERELK